MNMSDTKPNLNAFYNRALNEKAEEESLSEQLMDDLRYQSMYSIGAGGAKKILRSRDKKTGRILAIAQLSGSPSEQEIKAFVHEARLQAALEHPGIPTVYDIDQNEDGLPFFTMQYIEGENLAEVLRNLKEGDDVYQRKYPLMRLLEIVEDVCEVVRYAHSQNVIHFDIKPENILIAKTKKVYLCDWGISAMRNNSDDEDFSELEQLHFLELKTMTMTGWIKGTPGYMSPEQASGQTVDKSYLCDIYALGGLLYSCLTYQAPIVGDEPLEVISKTRQGDLSKPSVVAQHFVPKELERVAMKALSLKPNKRHQSAEIFLTELKSFDFTKPVEAPVKKEENHVLRFVVLSLLISSITLALLLVFVTPNDSRPKIDSKENIKAKPQVIASSTKEETGRPEKDKESEAHSPRVEVNHQAPVRDVLVGAKKENSELADGSDQKVLPKVEEDIKEIVSTPLKKETLAETDQVIRREEPVSTAASATPAQTDKPLKEKYPLSESLRYRMQGNVSRTMFKKAYSELNDSQREKMENYLEKMDKNNDGKIEPFEIREMRSKNAPRPKRR